MKHLGMFRLSFLRSRPPRVAIRRSRRWRLLNLLLTLTLFSGALAGAPPVAADGELTVCASGCDYATVQAAIDAAAPGDTIKIATGSYPTAASITKNLTLRGGYNADFSAQDPILYPTTLDGGASAASSTSAARWRSACSACACSMAITPWAARTFMSRCHAAPGGLPHPGRARPLW